MTDFQYDNEFGSDYMLMPCLFDSNGGVETVDFGSQFSGEAISIVGTDETVNVNNTYSSMRFPTFQACKIDSSCNPLPISAEEFSKINRWLNRKESHKFKIKEESYENIYFLGKFNVQAIKINESIQGVSLTFQSDYPYGFVDEISINYKNCKEFMIYDHSDETGDIYPITTIKCLEPGTLRIANSMDNEILEINNCVANEVITIDNKHSVITSTVGTHDLCNDFNYNYFKICNTYNERRNNYSSTLNIDITIKYSPVRKVGI